MANHYDPDRPRPTAPITRSEAIALCQPGKLATLAERHLWLVSKHASQLSREWNVDYQSCYTAGCEALMLGVRRLKPDSTNPTAYLWSRVWGAIQDHCESEDHARKARRNVQRMADSRIRYGRQGKYRPCRHRQDDTLENILALCNETQAGMVKMLVDGHGMRSISQALGVPLSTLYASLKSLEMRYDLLFHRRVEKPQDFSSWFRKLG